MGMASRGEYLRMTAELVKDDNVAIQIILFSACFGLNASEEGLD